MTVEDLPIVFGTKPYSASKPSKLPKNVRKKPAKKRRQWILIFNQAMEKYGNESRAFAIANGVLKKYSDESRAFAAASGRTGKEK